VDFVRYAESSAALLNAELPDLDALVTFLDHRAWLQPQVNDRDVAVLRRFQRDLRLVFEASSHDDPKGVVDGLNTLLEKNPITPRIADHNPANLHIHVANRAASVADLLIGESLLGLATLVCDLGPDRLGVCSSAPCTNAFVDASPNRSRRYCSERCASRVNVAAYRARRRAVAQA
jgi:hypothetical protein